MAGYSGTPLIQKIGIKPGHRIILRNHPASFIKDLGKLPEGAESSDRISGKANVAVYFTERLADLEKISPCFRLRWYLTACYGSAGLRRPVDAQRTSRKTWCGAWDWPAD